MKSVIADGWKYTRHLTDGSEELYDLGEDPAERINLVSESPLHLTKLRELMREYMRSAAASRKSDLVPLDEETRDQLRALGYLE